MSTEQLSPIQREELELRQKLAENLELQLQTNPIYIELQSLRCKIDEMLGNTEEASPTPEIIAAAKKLFAETKTYTSVGEILKVIESRGIKVGGTDPKANLSAKLFNSGEFVADRSKGGWILKEYAVEQDNNNNVAGGAAVAA